MTTAKNNNEQSSDEEMKFEMVQTAEALAVIVKSEIDMQIATAKAYPRSVTKFRSKVLELATINEDVAESCTYALPVKETVGNSTVTKSLTGPSVRLAEIVCSNYGNVRAGARVIANDGKQITAQGIFHDLESNVAIQFEVRRSIRTKTGKMYSDHLQVVTGNAACAIAFRNVVFKGIPGAYITDIYEKIQEVAKGTTETLGKRRDKAIKFFTERKVKLEQILEVLGVAGVEEIDLDKLAILSGMKASMVNGEVTEIQDLFQPQEKDSKETGKKANGDAMNMMDGFKGKAKDEAKK